MAIKKYDVTIARRADSMMLSHTEFLAQVSSAAAQRLITEFKKAIKRIEDNPFQFPFADELDVPGIPLKMYRKCFFCGRYKALFTVENDDAYIDSIIDCRQENKNLYNEEREV